MGGPWGGALAGLGMGLLGMGVANNMKQPDPMKWVNKLPGVGQQYADQLWQMQGGQMQNLAMQGARATMSGMRNGMAGTGGMRTGLGQAGLALSRGAYFNNLMQARAQNNMMGMQMAQQMIPYAMQQDQQNYQQKMAMYGAGLNVMGSGLTNFRKKD
jgi:hypothetical protein